MTAHPSPARRRLLAVAVTLPAVLVGTTGPGPANATALPDRAAHAAAPITGNLTTRGLATGERPHIPFLRGFGVGTTHEHWRLVRADHTRLAVPGTHYTAFAPLGRGLIGLRILRHPIGTQITGSGRVVRRTVVRGYRLAASPDHSIVGWLGAKGWPRVFEGGGRRTFAMPRVAKGAAIAAINGSGTCKEQAPEGGGCAVYVNSGDFSRAWVSTSHGLVGRAGPMRSVADVARNGRIIGLKRIFDQGSCSGLWSPGGVLRWRTCRFMLQAFSPGAKRIVAGSAFAEGFGDTRLAILRSDGRRLVDYQRATRHGATVLGTAWEDSTHVLAVLFQGGKWSIVRYGVDGSKEFAIPPVRLPAERGPFLLPTR